MPSQESLVWRRPGEIVEIGFQRASVVMMREAHSGLKRCVQIRQVELSNVSEIERYRRWQEFQPELATLEFTNWRERQQGLHLITTLQNLPANTPLLLWCGNNHHAKKAGEGRIPMGHQFQHHSSINPFVIDQLFSVKFDPADDFMETEIVTPFSEELARHGGTAGLLIEELPLSFARFNFQELGDDALLLSAQNELE